MDIEFYLNHPFYLVLVGVTIFMFFLYKDVYKWKRHQKHLKDIEEKKRRKALKS